MWINTEQDLINGILKHGPDVLENAIVDKLDQNVNIYLDRCLSEKLDYPTPISENLVNRNWFVPYDYQNFDIETHCRELCKTSIELERVNLELELFKKHNLIDVLNAMKFIVDTLKKNNILWGVGRGSSVSSYVLFLLGIHKIDSIKYNLPITEFFKEI